MLWRPVFVVILAVLAVNGCGSASTKIRSPIKRPTKAQYIAEADAICRGARPEAEALKARITALWRRLGATKEALSLTRVLDSHVGAIYATLRALPKPPNEARTLDGLFTALSASLAYASNALNALASHELGKAYVAAGRRAATFARGLVRKYGFKVCGVAE